jgi:GntR family transcriptional repressor for pyruvate dehydrogenase complex
MSDLKIEPIQRIHLPEQVAERIKDYIEANALHTGDRIPGERELASSLGVSRNVTREAVSALQATGILDVRPGNGIFVAEFGFEALANHFNFVIRRQQHQLKHLIEARVLFENGILELVAGRLTDRDVALLEEAAQRIGTAENSEEDQAAELAFHEQLVRATGNPVLIEFTPFFNRFFHEGRKVTGNTFGSVAAQQTDAKEHLALIRALQDGNVELAKNILEKSIRRWER